MARGHPRHGARHARRRHRAGERGSVALEVAIVMPVVLTLFFLGLQAALLYMGRTAALAAAQEGAQVAAGESGTIAGGIAAAQGLADASTMVLESMSVTGVKTATEAHMTVSVRVASLVPGWQPQVTASVAMPVEEVTG
ncbi:TadE/TadG family type IV pilus assembly protein [Isoptericola jiangsuensis]|nr:TadE family protein [Isoptericola jiangsuensis]